MLRASIPLCLMLLALLQGCALGTETEGGGRLDPLPVQPAARRAAIVAGSTESGFTGVGGLLLKVPGGYTGSFCSGALIDARWVLTAAHCLEDPPENFGEVTASRISFFTGTSLAEAGDASLHHDVLALHVHPDYEPVYQRNDIALMRLTAAASGVETYPTGSAGVLEPGPVRYVGYGAVEGVEQSGSGTRRSATAQLQSISTETLLSSFDGRGSCFGDSGAPAFVAHDGVERLVGVVSGGVVCDPASDPTCPADPCHVPTISARVDAYSSWIAELLGQPLPDCRDNASLCPCADACQGDGSCDGSACQVLACDALYACMLDCGADGGCQSDCYLRGQDPARTAIDALVSCLDMRCSGLDGSELASCADRDCGSEIGACFPVSSGVLSCYEVRQCMAACNDDACLQGCFEQGTPDAQDDYNGYVICASDNCSLGNGLVGSACVARECRSELTACEPAPGGDSCEQIWRCIGGCSGDTECALGCYWAGSAGARSQSDALSACLDSECGSASDRGACASSQCASESAACFPPAMCAMTGGDCGANEACFPTASGVTDCYRSNGARLGEPCQGSTNELACADGMLCIRQGGGDAFCARACVEDHHCIGGQSCQKPVLSQDASVGVCLDAPGGDPQSGTGTDPGTGQTSGGEQMEEGVTSPASEAVTLLDTPEAVDPLASDAGAMGASPEPPDPEAVEPEPARMAQMDVLDAGAGGVDDGVDAGVSGGAGSKQQVVLVRSDSCSLASGRGEPRASAGRFWQLLLLLALCRLGRRLGRPVRPGVGRRACGRVAPPWG